jgi:hypothetical protein
VLDDLGAGTLSDALSGIQWVIFHAKEYNIKVLNISLAANSPESWLTDPLCIAVRSASAAGITVVVAAGNYGQNSLGQETYGAIGSPGIDPSVITVGAVNFKGTLARSDDSVNLLQLARADAGLDGSIRTASAASTTCSSPTSSHRATSSSPRRRRRRRARARTWNALATSYYGTLVAPLAIAPVYGETQMMLSGTSISAPAVAGTVGAHARGDAGTDAAGDQGDPAVHRAAAAEREPAAAGRGPPERRRRHPARQGIEARSRQKIAAGEYAIGAAINADRAADAGVDGQRADVQLVANRLRRRQPRRQRRGVVHPVPGDLGSAPDVGRRRRAQAPGRLLVGQRHRRQHLSPIVHRQRRVQPGPADARRWSAPTRWPGSPRGSAGRARSSPCRRCRAGSSAAAAWC